MKFYMRESIDMFNAALGSWANMYFPDYFGFKIIAYNMHNRVLAQKMFKLIKEMEPTEAFFDLHKPALLKTLAVFDMQHPSTIAEELIRVTLETNQYENGIIVDACRDITYEEFKDFTENFITNVNIEWLVQGHITAADTLAMIDDIESAFGIQHCPIEEGIRNRCVQLDPATIYILEKVHPDQRNKINVVHESFSHEPCVRAVPHARMKVLQVVIQQGLNYFNSLLAKDQGFMIQCFLSTH
jgi:secreted Zn-dependent insulinase-like peptidase